MGRNWRRRIGEWSARYWRISTLLGLGMLVLGLPGYFEDIQTWAHWLTQPAWLRWLRWLPWDLVREQGVWWAFMVAGLTVIILSNLPRLLTIVGKSDWAEQLGLVTAGPPIFAAAMASGSDGKPSDGESTDESDAERQRGVRPGASGPVPAPEEDNLAFSREGYEDRYGVLWRANYNKRVYTGLFASLNAILNAPPKVKIEGPFCRQDGTLLRFKDAAGIRYLMDNDDIGGSGGWLYCDLCDAETRPDPDYDGERLVATYREALRKELQDQFRVDD